MIIILDDTFGIRYKFNDISYLQENKYQHVCKIYDKPTMKGFREISSLLDKCALFCNHRSLKLYNNKGKSIDGAKVITNLYEEVKSKDISRIEFGRDMHTNFSANTLKKHIFYSNLKVFLDHYIAEHNIELKILFLGMNYPEIDKLTFFDKVIDEVNTTDIKKFKNNSLIIKGLKQLCPNSNPDEIIDKWIQTDLSKKEIRLFINNRI